MTTQWNANYIETMPFSDTDAQFALGTGTEQVYTVPGTNNMVYQAYFTYNDVSNVFVAVNATPVVPTAGSVGTQPYNEFRPEKRYVRGGDTIHCITPDTTAYVGATLRQLQG